MQLKNYLPSFILNKDLIKVLESQQIELDKLNLDLEDLKKQCFVSTATWGLKYWEEFVGINTNANNSIEERRARVLAKLRGTGTTTVEIIKQICKSFINDVDVIEYPNNYNFKIHLKTHIGFPYNLESLYSSVGEVKPAHLAVNYSLISITNSNLYYACASLGGEELTVYPWGPKNIESKGKINIAIGNNTSFEDITIYPRKEE